MRVFLHLPEELVEGSVAVLAIAVISYRALQT